MRGFNYKKAVQALNFLAKKSGGTINKMKAIKLIWLSDRLHLNKFGRLIIGDIYYALPLGPVPSSTRDVLEENNFSLSVDELEYSSKYIQQVNKYHYKSITEPNLKVFSKSDISVLETIYENYGLYNEMKLSDLSHTFPEWKKFESALEKKIASRFEMDFDDFFKPHTDWKGLFNQPLESLAVSREIFKENNKLSAIC